MKKILVGVLTILLSIVLLLAWLNPSYADFEHYANDFYTNKRKAILRKTANYIIFSRYQKQIFTINKNEYTEKEVIKFEAPEEYYGFLMNFY